MRGQGVYALQKAQADSINLETMIKWNKALRERQRALREQKQQEQASKEAARERRVADLELKDGTTLNNLLLEILDADPAVARSSRAKMPVSTAAIREIPFEWDSEALTICLDQMTGEDSLPDILMRPEYTEQRNALHAAVKPALEEDARGDVSAATRQRIDKAVADFRATFMKNASEFTPGYQDALDYFTTMASLNRLLNDPSMKAFLDQLEDTKQSTVGNLVAFMNAYNLRFGATTSDRQVEIYSQLLPGLVALRNEIASQHAQASNADRSGAGLRSAARAAFKGMNWQELQAQQKGK